MPFDRLVKQMDDWAGRTGRGDVFAQIGPSNYAPQHISAVQFMTPDAFRERIHDAEAVVAHAGMGTIIEVLQQGKPLLVFPRTGDLAETRNDHQIATAKRFAESGRILAAYSDQELVTKLEKLVEFVPSASLGTSASTELIERIRRFVFEE